MSSSSSPNGQGDPAEEESPKESPVEEASEAVVETVECPNCGRTFVGDYCPGCGQEANPSVSVTGVIGGLFRELVDVESGFWPTLVGLTIRPGKTLRRYLSGERAGLASPGRYLLAAVVFGVGINWLLYWIGASGPPGYNPDPHIAFEEGRNALGAAIDKVVGVIFSGQAQVVVFLLFTGFLALLLWRLFRSRFGRGGEALGVGCLLTGHGVFLLEGIYLAYSLPAYVAAGHATDPPYLFVLTMPLYIGIAGYRCFGPGWIPALKATFSVAWATVEVFSTLLVVSEIYAARLNRAHPQAYYVDFPDQVWVYAVLAGIISVPLLLHAGVEAYYRLR